LITVAIIIVVIIIIIMADLFGTVDGTGLVFFSYCRLDDK